MEADVSKTPVVLSRLCWLLTTCLIGLLASFTRAENRSLAAPAVAFVGCPADGQQGPQPPPTGAAVVVELDPELAAHLAYYKGDYGPGVFAPAGWQCRTWYGSAGALTVVTPAVPPADGDLAHSLFGPGVAVERTDGGTSGRFEVAAVSARFFPDLMRNFIRQVRDEKLIEDSAFDVRPYPDDVLDPIAENMIEFLTPAGRSGFGGEGMAKSDLPINGVVTIADPDGEPSLLVLRIRLPTEQDRLNAALVPLNEACFQRGRSC
jgi:hypothetical protein